MSSRNIDKESSRDGDAAHLERGWSWRPRLAHGLLVILALAMTGGAWLGAHTGPGDEPPMRPVADTSDRDEAASRDHDRPPPQVPTDPPSATPTEEPPSPPEAKPTEPEEETGPPGDDVVVGPDCDSYSGHRATACGVLAEFGFDSGQMTCLSPLWDHESGWNPNASNPSSGAYGIPQALPGDKMASAGSDWRTNAATQIRWGLGYIADRYGDPCGAWAFWQANNWY